MSPLPSRTPRPTEVPAITIKKSVGCGSLYVTVGMHADEDGNPRPFEVFARLGKAGGCASAICESIGRMSSLALQYGIPESAIIKQLSDVKCPSPGLEQEGLSCPDAVARALSESVDKYISGERVLLEERLVRKVAKKLGVKEEPYGEGTPDTTQPRKRKSTPKGKDRDKPSPKGGPVPPNDGGPPTEAKGADG